jgi:crotonobetainyl-CoA:carnitine CoA-transferase CaiB-like acyl-CoA transferase
VTQGYFKDVIMFSESYRGIRVVDLATNIAGPLAAMIMGDMGADVIKVERGPLGDDTRQLSPVHKGASTVYLSVNRNKRSVLLDFKNADDLERIKRLVAGADVLIDSFPPGVAAKLGLEFEQTKVLNHSIVHCSISAFGDGKTGRTKPGYDALVQAYSGLMSFTGEASGPAVRIAPSTLDISTGMWSAMAIMAAIRNREHGSGAQHIRPSLIDSAFMMMCHQVAGFTATGEDPVKYGSGAPSAVPYRVYKASDGEFMLATSTDAQFLRLSEALSAPKMAAESRFSGMAARIAHRDELDQLLEEIFERESVQFWLARLEYHKIPAGPVHSLSEALETNVVRERELFLKPQDLAWEDGLPLVRSPLDVNGTGWFRPPPLLGEHTAEVLAELEKNNAV